MQQFILSLNPDELLQVRTACAYLFTPQQAKDDHFLNTLNQEAIQSAFRTKAKQYHPDTHQHESHEMLLRRKERFIKIRQSYELMADKLPHRPAPGRYRSKQRTNKIIAVGGAKGGIGKSIFAANLGIALARTGAKTTVMDLDLGGANLHLYLGQTMVRGSINDFLSKKVNSLDEISTPTRFGPRLIGGDSSQLGSANISFAEKIKLIRAIRNMEAEYVVLDLGGDTSYNIMDFFLMADKGLVLTTCDPASYLDAYNFIKVGLFRKLNRIFGTENLSPPKRDIPLEQIIANATTKSDGDRVANITTLYNRISKQRPSGLGLVKKAVRDYAPKLVVNRQSNICNPGEIVGRIQDVSKKMLTIDIPFLGSLPLETQVEISARELVPVLQRAPNSQFAATLESIRKKI